MVDNQGFLLVKNVISLCFINDITFIEKLGLLLLLIIIIEFWIPAGLPDNTKEIKGPF